MPASVPCLCGLPFSSLLSSKRSGTATCSGVMLSKAPTFEGYILYWARGTRCADVFEGALNQTFLHVSLLTLV